MILTILRTTDPGPVLTAVRVATMTAGAVNGDVAVPVLAPLAVIYQAGFDMVLIKF